MAAGTFSAVFTPSAESCKTATLSTVTASALITIGANRNFIVTASGAFNLKVVNSNSTTTTATASDFEFPGSAVFTIGTGPNCDSVSIFNPGAGSITYWLQPLE